MFISGHLSQFEGWQIEPHKLFEKIKAYCIKYEGSGYKCHKGINARLLLLDKNVRDEDAKYAAIVWKDIEEYLFSKSAY